MERAEIVDAEWPTVTRELLRDHEKLAATHAPEQINQPLFSLIRARKALMDAKLAVQRASMNFDQTKPEVKERLQAISKAIQIEHDRFPLTILVNMSRPRPPIMR